MSSTFTLEPGLLFIVILRLRLCFPNFLGAFGLAACPLLFRQRIKDKLSKEVKGHLRFLCLPCFESGMHKLLYDKVHTKMCLSPVAVSGRSCGLAALPHTSVTLNFRGRLPKTVNVVLNSETVPKPS